MSIRTVIVDDEMLARKSVRRFLRMHSDVNVVGECADGESAVNMILQEKPQLVFLDIQMPEMDGFEVVRRLGAQSIPATVFVTAYDRYALLAFEANGLDYLLKPFGQERFDRALVRVRKQISAEVCLGESRLTRTFVTQLPIQEHGRIVLVKTADIVWIEADGNYARVHLRNRQHTVRETLQVLEHRLDPRDFVRIHRSAIVNVNHIKEIRPWFRGYHLVVLENGEEVRMSRYQRASAVRLGITRDSF